ncbi:MAG: hypothetical protein E7K75_04695 [Finegoldia magna]|uniref:hypothetical protein n=1 Tax=Finegoldia magna TaxID=1260 RepID=UPI0026EB59AF|nr:hypothetical protein [Finegoldia magna]MBS5777319.1 hypothetical protein [Finegoldia magna]MDU2575808.1 hypothetical protein [Finegoldia magna]MDU5998962.1 hypothetical protein [Finegoldia magna]MDU7479741.1 hypothetical protein [Finegoldia magna]MDU7501834.1 hypothetical protein [Finegoldia magna]
MKISSFEASLIRSIKFYMMIFLASIVCLKVSRVLGIAKQGQKIVQRFCWTTVARHARVESIANISHEYPDYENK